MKNNLEDLDRQVREIMAEAATKAMGLIPAYIAVNPARGMRVATQVAQAVGRILADTGAEDGEEEGPMFGGLSHNGPLMKKKRMGTPEAMLGTIADSTGGMNLSTRVNNLTRALQTALQLDDKALAAQIRDELDVTLAEMRGKRTPEPEPNTHAFAESLALGPIGEAEYEDA